MTLRDEADGRRVNAQLEALFEATMTITAELALDRVLQRIVDLARSLVSAQYAALGVPSASGTSLEKFVTSGMTPEEVQRVGHLPEGKGLLGLLLREPQPIRVRRLDDDPRSAGVIEGHPRMSNFLGVPIIFKGKLLGNLYLTDKQGADEFSEQDEHLITMLAAQAAIAIENANLYKQVQRLAVLEERERIAMDLHDGIIQSIYAVGLMLEYAGLMFDESPAEARQRLQDSISGLNEVIRDIRNYILDLRPQRFQSKNLSAGLVELVRAFKANTLITVEVHSADRADADLTTVQSTGLFHITQEALANIAKHGRARTVVMSLRRESQRVILSIQDDGRGFDTSTVKAYTGHGLQNMQERARVMGAQLRIDSAPGQGTLIEVVVNVDTAQQ